MSFSVLSKSVNQMSVNYVVTVESVTYYVSEDFVIT